MYHQRISCETAPSARIIFLVAQTTSRVESAARAKFFRSLGDASRLAILELLREREMTAGQIAAAAHLTASNASKHLACLRDCGLVEARQHWRHVHYRLAGEHVAHLLDEADLVLQVVAVQMATCRPESWLAP